MKYLLIIYAGHRIDLVWLNSSNSLIEATNEGLQKLLSYCTPLDIDMPVWAGIHEVADGFVLNVAEVTDKRQMKKEKELEIEQRRVYEYLKEKFEG